MKKLRKLLILLILWIPYLGFTQVNKDVLIDLLIKDREANKEIVKSAGEYIEAQDSLIITLKNLLAYKEERIAILKSTNNTIQTSLSISTVSLDLLNKSIFDKDRRISSLQSDLKKSQKSKNSYRKISLGLFSVVVIETLIIILK